MTRRLLAAMWMIMAGGCFISALFLPQQQTTLTQYGLLALILFHLNEKV